MHERGAYGSERRPHSEEFSVRFLEWVEENAASEAKRKRYYQYGWLLLQFTDLAYATKSDYKITRRKT
jgi:hypothetical protein